MDGNINIFIKKTLEALDINKKDNRLGFRGFEYDKSETEENCVLVIGLNPAGDITAAKNEKKRRTYLYSLRENIKSSYIYNKYYRPIYDLMKIGVLWRRKSKNLRITFI